MAKIKVHVRVSGAGRDNRTMVFTFDDRPADDKLIADAKLQHGLPDSSEFKVEQRGTNQTAIDVVATRTTWVIENQVIKVGGKDVRGGRAQTDWYQSSTYK